MIKTGITIVVVFALIFFGGKYLYEKNNNNLSKLDKNGAEIYLVTQSGDVYFKVPGAVDFVKSTSSPTSIPNQTIVKTDGGFASVILPSNSVISLSTSTEIAINYTASSTTIFQSIGQTYHRVQELLLGSTYQVQTPGTLAAVRGTKFGVAYDAKKKETKVSVTESKVSVSKVKKEFDIRATSTSDSGIGAESILVEAGNVAKVYARVDSQRTAIEVIKQSDDKEKDFSDWIERNKKDDKEYDKRMKDEVRGETRERRIIELLNKDSALELLEDKYDREDGDESEDIRSDIRERIESSLPLKQIIKPTQIISNEEDDDRETLIETTQTPRITDTRVQTIVENQAAMQEIIKVLSEEEFFNRFIPLFEDNFYLDDGDRACSFSRLATERVKIVSDFGAVNNREINIDTLSDFAKRIDEYCKSNRDPKTKAYLQMRFDEEFPYR